MKKILSLILLSVMLVLSGCGKSVSEQPEPVIEDQQDDSAEYQLVLDYGFESKKTSYVEGDNVKVYFSIIATDTDYTFYTDSDDVELKQDYDDKKGYVITFIMPDHDVALHVDSVNSMEYVSHTEFNYDDVDTKGLSKETLNLFAPCASYLKSGSNTADGDLLSSKEWDDIRDFIFYFLSSENLNVEFVHDYDGEDILTKQWRIKYEEWDYLLREVLNEKNPENVRNMMNTEFGGEMDVYYNPADDYVYKEVGTIGWGYEYAWVSEVEKDGNVYIITYDLYNGFDYFEAPYGRVKVTIAEADNKYGYTLISVESITEFDVWKIREILAAKYNCSESPFFTVFDHIDEDGMYVYHIYELVDGETESHTATIDWVYVDPATGAATTFFDEEFNIEDFEY